MIEDPAIRLSTLTDIMGRVLKKLEAQGDNEIRGVRNLRLFVDAVVEELRAEARRG